jgi:hypothetical protein
MKRHPGISMHRLPIAGELMGLVFTVGSCLIFLIGIPAMRYFLAGAIVVGAVFGTLLYRWHQRKPVEITDIKCDPKNPGRKP